MQQGQEAAGDSRMNGLAVWAMLKRVLMMISIAFMLSSCVTVYTSEPRQAGLIASSSPLHIVKKRMSSCVIEYAIETGKSENLNVSFNANNQQITYQSTDSTLADYMKTCAGTSYDGHDKDSGSITTSSIKE